MLAERLEQRVAYKHQERFKLLLALGFPVLVLVAWELIVGVGILNPRWFPSPTKIAIFPLMMLIFPNPFGEGSKIAVVAISAFFLVAISTMAGVREIEGVYLEAGRNYGANRWQMLRHVIVPGALPIIFSGLRLALGTALIVVVAVEFIRSQTGVGFLVFYYWQILVTEKMCAALFVVMALGVLLTYGLQWLEKLVMPWRK